ncbi:MAG: cyclohexanecarboxyl-CoA dehydrogenase [Rhizobium sp.]|nr:cyclohexanecarboxyl-CoA dehydrogenase [Rhizobium sp.]
MGAIQERMILHGHYGYAQGFPIEQRLRDVAGDLCGDPRSEQGIVVGLNMDHSGAEICLLSTAPRQAISGGSLARRGTRLVPDAEVGLARELHAGEVIDCQAGRHPWEKNILINCT